MTTEARRTPWIAAIVLAAGGSTRMGQSKQLLPISGQPMVHKVVAAVCAAGLAQVIVVVGSEAGAVAEALEGLPVNIVMNERWADGMSTSLQAGLRAMQPEAQAALIALADQPGLTPDLLAGLVSRYQDTGAAIVAPFYQGQRGNPVLFDRTLFAELLAVQGDRGGRSVIARHAQEVERVDLTGSAMLIDVDTPEEYDTAKEP
jgi:molybdenum cofactor cytidylyltransferase